MFFNICFDILSASAFKQIWAKDLNAIIWVVIELVSRYVVRANQFSIIIDLDMLLIIGKLYANSATDVARIYGVLAFAKDHHRFLGDDTGNIFFEIRNE